VLKNNHVLAQHQWLTPVIPATQEAEIRRITVRSQSGQISPKTISRKTLSQKMGLVEWLKVKGEGPDFKPQYLKKKKKIMSSMLLFCFVCGAGV
jgi:hypothetical protein